MNSGTFWKLFVTTGNISAYLLYKSYISEEEQKIDAGCESQGGYK